MPSQIKSGTPADKRKPFHEFLAALNGGEVDEELTDEMNEMVHAITETRKGGEITVKFKMKPVGKGTQVEIDPIISVKRPKPAKNVVLMFATPDNNLSRDMPKQKQIEGLRSADDEADRQAGIRSAS